MKDTPSFLDDVRGSMKGVGGPTCTVKMLVHTMAPEDYADLHKAFADPMIPVTAIWRALNARGVVVSQGALARHRRDECLCRR